MSTNIVTYFRAGVAVLLVACLFHQTANGADKASNLVNQLNPINVALGPLIDDAIADGNEALAQRLEQLRNIIQEAIFNLNKMIQERTTQINADAEGRLDQLNNYVNDNLQLLNSLASGQVSTIDTDVGNRIDQLGDRTGNLIEALPIPTQPLPNVPGKGFSLVRATGKDAPTPLFITGAGLRKGGSSPEAYLLTGKKADSHWISHDGTPLEVKAASMGLVELNIPQTAFPADGQVEQTLVLKLRSGNYLRTHVEPTFPLLLCSRLPKYSAVVTREAVGQVWRTRVVPHPRAGGTDQRIYIDDNGSNNSTNVCADEADTPDWKSDPDAANYGLEWVGLKEHVGATLKNQPRAGCLRLYAAKDSSGGGFATAWGLQVHQRKLERGSCGSDVSSRIPLKFGPSNAIAGDVNKLLGQCVASTSGATITARMRTHIAVLEDGGATDQQDVGAGPSSLLGGAVTASVDSYGLVKVAVNPQCGRKN